MDYLFSFPNEDATIIGTGDQYCSIIVERDTANFRFGIAIFQFHKTGTAQANAPQYCGRSDWMIRLLDCRIVHMMTKIPQMNLPIQRSDG